MVMPRIIQKTGQKLIRLSPALIDIRIQVSKKPEKNM